MDDLPKFGCDVHKDYSVFRSQDARMGQGPPVRVVHKNGELDRYLMTLPPGGSVALEACGSWMWMVGRLEAAGLVPHLADPGKAKKRMAGSTRTDASDAAGLAMLLASGTLPEVWMAPPAVRDLRSLVRVRLALRQDQASFKNRIHGTLNQYGLKNWVEEEDDVDVRDWLTVKAQEHLAKAIEQLPSASQEAMRQQWMAVRDLEVRIRSLEIAIKARTGKPGWLRNLQTMPGVGQILGPAIGLEIGDVKRFPSAQHLAKYAGLVPQVQSSGGKTWRGPTSKDCNHYLKWAFVEAANVIVSQQAKMEKKHPHVVGLYRRVKATTKLSGKAKVAVALHLAEASWWMLTRKRAYSEPASFRVISSNNG